MRLAFDPAIQAIRADFAAGIFSYACERAKAEPDANLGIATLIDEYTASTPEITAALADSNKNALVDFDAVQVEIERCQAEAALFAPHGDGFYTVGEEIAPGLWESNGTSDDCYWERLDQAQDILDNHFGDAGGTVSIRASDFEIHFEDCGTWTLVG